MFNEFSGIDEAALGPILGPYCVTVVSIKKESEEELFETFSNFNHLKIADSKKLYTSGKSIKNLESTALTFISFLLGTVPHTLFDLLNALIIDTTYVKKMLEIPWYKKITTFKLPHHCNKNDINLLKNELSTFMSKKKLKLSRIQIDVVPARRFNHYLNKGLNKSQTCQQIISPLIKNLMDCKNRLTVDRQGGRRYYGEWLIEIFPGSSLSIIKETPDLSSYYLKDSIIHFQVKGDDKFFETALASIVSKYIRELIMVCFNDYWQEKTPGIKATAGYPQDGKRFIKDLNKSKISFDDESLIRKK